MNELYHYGVRGMRWGHHKSNSVSAMYSRYNNKLLSSASSKPYTSRYRDKFEKEQIAESRAYRPQNADISDIISRANARGLMTNSQKREYSNREIAESRKPITNTPAIARPNSFDIYSRANSRGIKSNWQTASPITSARRPENETFQSQRARMEQEQAARTEDARSELDYVNSSAYKKQLLKSHLKNTVSNTVNNLIFGPRNAYQESRTKFQSRRRR